MRRRAGATQTAKEDIDDRRGRAVYSIQKCRATNANIRGSFVSAL